jgi:uncharacterized protein (TIGR02996 family)
MTDTETALLRVIAAQPDEDTPRLVYADYLDESGDPSSAARAEFIRLHTRAARLPPDSPERGFLDRRVDQLLCAWDVAWQREWPDGYKRLCGYRRGFAHRVASSASTLTTAADDPRLLFVDYLELTPDVSGSQLGAVLGHPLFARLTELVVRGGPLGPEGTRVLAAGQYPRLERLVLAGSMPGDADLSALGRSDGFPRLRVLDLAINAITAAGLDEFRRLPLAGRLDQLRGVDHLRARA